MNVREKIIYYLSRRDHSTKELQQKLRLKKYSSQEIIDGIQWAEERGYLSSPDHTAEVMSRGLHRKKKGILYINQYLNSKGLPSIETDWELEYTKANDVCIKLFGSAFFENPPYTFEQKQDIYKALARRGFLDRTIQEICAQKK